MAGLIGFVNSASAGNSSGTGVSTQVITKPSGICPGDLMVAFVTAPTSPTITAPSSAWTSITTNHDTAASLSGTMYTAIAGPSEPSTYTWTLGSASDWCVGMSVYRGFNDWGSSTTPGVDVFGSNATGTTNPCTAPTVTTTTADWMIYFHCDNGSNSTASTHSVTGLTKRLDYGVQQNFRTGAIWDSNGTVSVGSQGGYSETSSHAVTCGVNIVAGLMLGVPPIRSNMAVRRAASY